MPRWFNVAGPCNPADHYMLPATRRLPKIRRLIDRKSYFVLHAPRQVGKTTALLALGRELTAEGRFVAVLLSVEVGGLPGRYGRGGAGDPRRLAGRRAGAAAGGAPATAVARRLAGS